MNSLSWGLPPAELQAMLLETALRVLAAGGLVTIALASLAYFLLWVVESRMPRRPRRR
jgi:hypothetical protein